MSHRREQTNEFTNHFILFFLIYLQKNVQVANFQIMEVKICNLKVLRLNSFEYPFGICTRGGNDPSI